MIYKQIYFHKFNNKISLTLERYHFILLYLRFKFQLKNRIKNVKKQRSFIMEYDA